QAPATGLLYPRLPHVLTPSASTGVKIVMAEQHVAELVAEHIRGDAALRSVQCVGIDAHPEQGACIPPVPAHPVARPCAVAAEDRHMIVLTRILRERLLLGLADARGGGTDHPSIKIINVIVAIIGVA